MLKIMEMQTILNNEVFEVPALLVQDKIKEATRIHKKIVNKGFEHNLDWTLKCILTEAAMEWEEEKWDRIFYVFKELGLDKERFEDEEMEDVERYYTNTTSKLCRETNKEKFIELQQEFLDKFPKATTFNSWRSVEDIFDTVRG
ncbi:hypothetical protein [Clostridium sp. UBA1652]|uniref:hypothetical protein n=1 Tax=Clostridium sp. UBA1652 TaxID=1946348 RepID=UPI00257FE3A8|nr:hypothetical protein [Clostridium sp. UBA1652]